MFRYRGDFDAMASLSMLLNHSAGCSQDICMELSGHQFLHIKLRNIIIVNVSAYIFLVFILIFPIKNMYRIAENDPGGRGKTGTYTNKLNVFQMNSVFLL
jgi:hypothetical protein